MVREDNGSKSPERGKLLAVEAWRAKKARDQNRRQRFSHARCSLWDDEFKPPTTAIISRQESREFMNFGKARRAPHRHPPRGSALTMLDAQHGLPREPALDQPSGEITDLRPGRLHIDVRNQLSPTDEPGEPGKRGRGRDAA